MASKQLGKLRQWGREVISSKDKTVLTEEFKEVEQDVELRKVGVEKLHDACSEYHAYLQKKKEYPIVEQGVKMLPVDALGAVMMSHGEEFGSDSAFGQCLVKLGRAHCKIATLQETYALTFRDTYFASLENSLEDFGDYTSQRKKLDSRRLAYDAAVTKASKAKKEKDVKEAEEEVTKAKLRYEETSVDVQSRMQALQENEIRQLRDLTDWLEHETRFVTQYLDVLRNTQDEWLDESVIQPAETSRRRVTPHAFASGRSTPSILSTSKTLSGPRTSSASPAVATPSDDDDADEFGYNGKRRSSLANTPRPNSRGSTRSTGTAHTGKRRSDSVGSESVVSGKRTGVANWASSAVSSLSGSGRSKKDTKKDKGSVKERDKGAVRAFASLGDAGDESEDGNAGDGAFVTEELPRSFGSSTLSRVFAQRQNSNPVNSSSGSSFNSSTSAPTTSHRVVRAVYDFAGSSDELSFRTGDEIIVISEAKSGWSMGETSGRRGLFPISYVEDVPASRTGGPAPTQSRMTVIAQRAQIDVTSEDGDGESILSEDLHGGSRVVGLYDEPFGDHLLAKSPMVAEHEHERPSTTEEEDEMRGLFGPLTPASVLESGKPPGHSFDIGNAAGNGVSTTRLPPALPQRKYSVKKPPPPPPPVRRMTVGSSSAPTYTVSSMSAPTSTANLSAAVSFPPPPAAPRRSSTRSRSSTALSEALISASPFEN